MPFYAVSKRPVTVIKQYVNEADFENILSENEQLLVFEHESEALAIAAMLSPTNFQSDIERYYSMVVFEFAGTIDDDIPPEIVTADILADLYKTHERALYKNLLAAYYVREIMLQKKLPQEKMLEDDDSNPVQIPTYRLYAPYGTINKGYFQGKNGPLYIELCIELHAPSKGPKPKL